MLKIEPTQSKLNRINPNFDYPNWCFEKVISEEEVPNLKYWKSLPSIEHENYSVNLNKIKGTSHPSYKSKNWIKMLGNLDRLKPHYNLKNQLDFFNSGYNADSGFGYHKYGDIFIINGGNNRTCIAKFIGIETLNAKVTEYFFDNELFELHSAIEKCKIDIKPAPIGREEKIHLNFPNFPIVVDDFQLQKDFISFYESINHSYIQNIKARLYSHKLNKKGDGLKRIKSKEEFQEVFLELYSHKFLNLTSS